MTFAIDGMRTECIIHDPDGPVSIWEYEIAYDKWIESVMEMERWGLDLALAGDPPAEPTEGFCSWCGKPASLIRFECEHCGQSWDEEMVG